MIVVLGLAARACPAAFIVVGARAKRITKQVGGGVGETVGVVVAGIDVRP